MTVATTCSSKPMFPGTYAASAPDRPAVVMAESGRVLTYGELDDNSARLAAALHGLGLRKGDVVAMLSDNAPEAFEIYWAALCSGLYITAVNWHLSAEEAAYIVRDSGARVVIASVGVRNWPSDCSAWFLKCNSGIHSEGPSPVTYRMASCWPRRDHD